MLLPVSLQADVKFVGLKASLENNARALLPLASTKCDSAAWRVRRLFRDADKSIDEALQALGYYESSITKSLTWDAECWHAVFEIQTGEPIRIRRSNILVSGPGSNDPALVISTELHKPAVNEVLHHGNYESYKAAMLRAATNAGYFDAEFSSSSVTVDLEARAADIDLQVQSGSKYSFGTITFTEDIIREKTLRRYTDIRPGDPYSATAINELHEALSGSSYFSSVAINTEIRDKTEKTVPINVILTPAKRRAYTVGGGFTTDTGPRGRLDFTNRRLNDRGHQFESKLFVSPVRSQLDATYRWPRSNPRREWFSAVAGAQRENTDTSTSDIFKLGLFLTKSRGQAWLETNYIEFEHEDYEIAEVEDTSQLIVFGTNWDTEKGRTLGRVPNGYRFNFDVRGASDAIGSDTSFLQLQAKTRWIHSLNDKTRVLARAKVATTIKDEFSELPASVRYFAGGDSSVRGYEYESLGPENAEGEVIGGSNLLEFSAEIDWLLKDKWAIAAFVDTGSAFNGSDITFSTGVGIGLRWFSPIGPIRIEFAHPLDDPDNDFRLHIGLGPDL